MEVLQKDKCPQNNGRQPHDSVVRSHKKKLTNENAMNCISFIIISSSAVIGLTPIQY